MKLKLNDLIPKTRREWVRLAIDIFILIFYAVVLLHIANVCQECFQAGFGEGMKIYVPNITIITPLTG